MDYSVFDWALEKWRVFRAPARDDGLFDPVIPPRKCDQRFGLAPEAACVGVPPGAQYVGVSATPRGRVAVDAKARSQARATLPSGLGSIGISIGGLGEDAPQVQPGLLARALNWVKDHPFLTGGVILVAAMAAQQHGLISNRRKKNPRSRKPSRRAGERLYRDIAQQLARAASTKYWVPSAAIRRSSTRDQRALFDQRVIVQDPNVEDRKRIQREEEVSGMKWALVRFPDVVELHGMRFPGGVEMLLPLSEIKQQR